MPTTPPPRKPLRPPIFGLLKPGQSRTYTIEPPIGDHEKPLIMGPTDQFSFDQTSASQIVLHNQSGRIVACMVTIVPKFVANATMVPWGRLWDQLKKPGGAEQLLQGVFDRLRANLLDSSDE